MWYLFRYNPREAGTLQRAEQQKNPENLSNRSVYPELTKKNLLYD